MGERVGGGEADERRAGHLPERQREHLRHHTFALERGDTLRRALVERGDEVTGGEVAAAAAGGLPFDAGHEEVLAAHDVIDQLADLPRRARRVGVELIRLDPGQDPSGRGNGLLQRLRCSWAASPDRVGGRARPYRCGCARLQGASPGSRSSADSGPASRRSASLVHTRWPGGGKPNNSSSRGVDPSTKRVHPGCVDFDCTEW